VIRELWLSGIAALVTVCLWALGWLPVLERPTGDLMLRVPRPVDQPPGPFAAVLIDDESVARHGALPWPRSRIARLAEGIHRLGARGVVIDLVLSEPIAEEQDLALERALTAGPVVLAAVLRPGGGWLLPLERFGGAANAAHAHAEIEGDGVVRSIASTKQAERLALPALAVAAARMAGWSGAVIPGNSLRPDFAESPMEIPGSSASDILEQRAEQDLFAGRVVFVGLSASGAGDRFVVPVGAGRRPTPGVLVHAATASAILRGGLLELPPSWLALFVAFASALAFQVLRTRTGRMPSIQLAVFVGLLLAVTLLVLWFGGVQLPVVSLVVAVALSVAFREIVESREAQLETGTILSSLIERQGAAHGSELPSSAAGRLQLVRSLQEQLARDRDLRRTLLEGLHEGVILWASDGRPLLSNAAFARLWGFEASARDATEAAGRDAGDWGDPPQQELDRQGRALELEIRPLQDGSLGILRDISSRRELDRRRREMQRLVSHELKTPLSSIAGFGTMLESYTLSEDELRRVAGTIRGEAERLGEMVHTFLDLERLGSGRWEVEKERLDLAALVRARCELLAPSAAQRAQSISFNASQIGSIVGAPQLLERLIDNLVGNALKFSPEGGVVDVELNEDDGGTMLSVSDHGPGIPREAIPHLFERFYRVPGTGQSGSGLGLAVVREIAEWHAATVEVESEQGRGTVFRVRFPTSEETGVHHGGESSGR
jgi:signal transduction histidine kinase